MCKICFDSNLTCFNYNLACYAIISVENILESFFFPTSLVNVVRQYVHAEIELLNRFCNVQEAEIGNRLLDSEIA